MSPTTPALRSAPAHTGPLFIIGALFFIFGFVTWVNSVLIAFFKQAFGLSTLGSNLVAFAFFISYTVMAIPSSRVLERTGFKSGMSLGLGVMAAGTLTFVPAARLGSYPLFLVGLFLIGIGLTVLQTASNPYVTILGPRESAAQRISFMGVANKLAGIASQYVFGGLLLRGAGSSPAGPASLTRVVLPYAVLTAVLIALAMMVRFSALPEASEAQPEAPANEPAPDASDAAASIWAHPNLVLGVIALFCYVGAEVIAGDTIINYGRALGFATDRARYFAAYTLYGMLAGYLFGIVAIPRWVSQSAALRASAVLGLALTTGALLAPGGLSVLCIALLGVALAPIWPAIWPLALDRLGRFTKLGSALLIMAISGGALLPLAHGYLTDALSPRWAYALLLPLFGFILYYAVAGHRRRRW